MSKVMSKAQILRKRVFFLVWVIQVVFFILKLTALISWSWWWVISPMLFMCGWMVFFISVSIFCFGVAKHA